MFSIFKKISQLLTDREKQHIFLISFALVGMGLFETLGIASVLPFMVVLANPDMVYTNQWLKLIYDVFGFTNQQNFLFFLGFVVLGLLIFSNIYKALVFWLKLKFDNQLYYEVARRLLEAYLTKNYEFFINRNSYEMGKNIITEARNFSAGVISQSMDIFSCLMLCLFILTLLIIVDPYIAIIIFLILGGAYIFVYFFMRDHLSRIGRNQVAANTMKFRISGDALSSIKELKVLGREINFVEKFAIPALLHSQCNISAGMISQLPRYILEIIAFGGILLIVLYFLKSDQDFGRIIPILTIYAFSAYRLMPAIQQIFQGFSTVRVNLPALEIIHRDMITEQFENIIPAAPRIITKNIQPLHFNHELALKNITFKYKGSLELALKEINLTILPITSVGFVGETGSGKTTIVDLILGLLTPTTGHLLVDGIEITAANIHQWRCNLGYVPQQIYLCDDTVARNIALGVHEKDIDMSAVLRAARIANLYNFIQNELPDGFETVIGERGMRLSGGQRQRIGIARALYRDPAVLIMDEATSALDGITEEAVMDALRALSGKKTIITIAHRLTTVKDCDIIYLMDKGRIVDQGSYDELQRTSLWFQKATRIA